MPARKSFALRLSQDLWDEIQRMAEQELRSVNGQIEFLLREAVRSRRKTGGQPSGKNDSPESD